MEELRVVFRARYHAFKLLLAANNTALQLMTDLEAALRGKHSFGMTFIRSHATAVCVNVFNIISNLNELTESRYQALVNIFSGIEKQIDATLSRRQAPTDLGVGAAPYHRAPGDG
jgi:pyruvate,water dikinase